MESFLCLEPRVLEEDQADWNLCPEWIWAVPIIYLQTSETGSILGLKIAGANVCYALLPHLTASNQILHLTRYQLTSEDFVPYPLELAASDGCFRKNPAPQTMNWQ